ncbi:hypothetical protein K474DRAFT_1711083 [Panus rudis PR-1116 ss-1]|nr:hypothetical protein K474DRAFT_1711083 [Panus rudis PR-1116 ss-1]
MSQPRERYDLVVPNFPMPRDTPRPKSSGKRTADVASDQQERIGGIEKAIIEEMRSAVFGDTPKFLETHFPLEQGVIDSIYAECIAEVAKPSNVPPVGYDRNAHRWQPFPPLEGASEASLYSPFCHASNVICRIAAKLQGRKEPRLHWKAVPNAAPCNSDNLAAKLRPDIIAIINGKCSSYFEHTDESYSEDEETAPSQDDGNVQNQAGSRPPHAAGSMANLHVEDAGSRVFPTPEALNQTKDDVAPGETSLPSPPAQSDSEYIRRNAWRLVAIPVEGKTSRNATALAQILRYQRQVFLNEHARRFTYSIVIANCFVTVYLTDRSGAMGAVTFDMHKHAKTFIRVIAGLEMKSPEELGWDPSMKLIPKNTDWFRLDRLVFKETYHVDPESKTDGPHYLVMQIPKPDSKKYASYGDGAEMESFVLHEPISLNRGRVIVGRATRIWRAWKDYVVKDAWRDERRGMEGELYAEIHSPNPSPCVAGLYSYGIVRVRIGDKVQDDSTEHIRRGLQVKGLPLCIDSKQTRTAEKRAKISTHSPKNSDSFITVHYTAYIDEIPEDDELYTRDANPTNGKKSVPLPQNRVHSRLVLTTYGKPIKFFESCLELVQAMRDAITGHRDAYRARVLHRDISIGNILIVDDRTKQHTMKSGSLIDFDNGVRWSFDREPVLDDQLSGTMPFVSGELLRKRPYFKNTDESVKESDLGPLARVLDLLDRQYEQTGAVVTAVVFHTWLHDLESFFWVLLWCCLSRDGPGGMRRKQLWGSDPAHKELRTLFRELFEHHPDEMALAKKELFIDTAHCASVLFQVSPYCRPLRPLLVDFSTILRDAFQERKYISDLNNTVHDQVINAFNKMEAALLTAPPPPVPRGEGRSEPNSSPGARPSQGKLREEMSPYAQWPAQQPIAGKLAAAGSQQVRQDLSTPRTPHRGHSVRENVPPPIPSLNAYQSTLSAGAPVDFDSDDDSRPIDPISPSPAERKGKDRNAGSSKRVKKGY